MAFSVKICASVAIHSGPITFRQPILFEREKMYDVPYKSIVLPHQFYADFVVFDEVILEIKAKDGIAPEDVDQTLNCLKCSGCKVGLILNFGKMKLDIKRVVF